MGNVVLKEENQLKLYSVNVAGSNTLSNVTGEFIDTYNEAGEAFDKIMHTLLTFCSARRQHGPNNNVYVTYLYKCVVHVL